VTVQECLLEFPLKLSAVILDMDGTITRFNIDYLGMRRVALAELEKMNLRTPDMTEQLSIYLLLKTLRERLNAETYKGLRRRFYGLLEEMEIRAAQEVALYPGAVETLRELQERHLKIGLVTNNGRAGTNLTLKRFGLEEFFNAIVTRDDCEEMKPDAGPVRQVLSELSLRTEEAVLVGDGVIDILAAQAAGLSSVAVGTGPLSVERLLRAEPDYVLASINDLPKLIDLLGSQCSQMAANTKELP
jgi:HAD superfamily hydrolase (TIGR01509 family)